MPKQTKVKTRSRSFSVTVFGDKPQKLDWMRYLCSQNELCPSTNKSHWQTYFYTSDPMSLAAVIKALPKEWKAHVEVSQGTPAQNILYCSKSEGIPNTFFETGIRPMPGRRTDLALACEEVTRGGILAVTNPEMIVRYGRGLTLLQRLEEAKRPHVYAAPHVEWIWGTTGTGKTRFCYQQDPLLYRQSSDDGWFDGYFGQETILIDDYSTDRLPLTQILHLLDGYKYDAKVKGGFQRVHAKKIFITSLHPPTTYFTSERYPEVQRRLTVVRELKVEV